MQAVKPQKNEKANLAEVRKVIKEAQARGVLTPAERLVLDEIGEVRAPERSKATLVPVVRPGQKKPYVKPTGKELRERYDIVAQLLAHKTKGQIRDFCRERWNVEWRTADRYMACA